MDTQARLVTHPSLVQRRGRRDDRPRYSASEQTLGKEASLSGCGKKIKLATKILGAEPMEGGLLWGGTEGKIKLATKILGT